MPSLVRVGAITERSRKLYEEADIPIYEDTGVLDSMEDDDRAISIGPTTRTEPEAKPVHQDHERLAKPESADAAARRFEPFARA